MGMLKSLSRVFHRNGAGSDSRSTPSSRRRTGRRGPHARHDGFALRTGLGQLTPEEAVEIQASFANGHLDNGEPELSDAAGADEGALGPRTPRNKQELLAELSQNYREVLSLVRKVDDHLDRHDRRSQRLIEIAEQLPAASETLEQIRKRNVELNVSLRDLIAAVNDSSGKAGATAEEHIKALGQIQAQLEQSGKSEERTAAAFNEFRASMKGITSSNTNLATVLERMNQRDLGRDLRLQDMVARTQKWMITLVLLSSVSVAAALGAVVLVSLRVF